MREPIKPYTTIDEQIDLLRKRGMTVDPSEADHK